jgi:hypothetical protein
MDNLIRDMVNKGLVSFVSRGKSAAVFNFLKIMAETVKYEPEYVRLSEN